MRVEQKNSDATPDVIRSGTVTVPGLVTLSPGGFDDEITVSGNQVIIQLIFSGGSFGFGTGSFVGFEFTDLTGTPDITAVILNAASNFGTAAGGIQFTGNSIALNFSGVSGNAVTNPKAVFDITFGPKATVPEPMALALLVPALAGLGLRSRRRAD